MPITGILNRCIFHILYEKADNKIIPKIPKKTPRAPNNLSFSLKNKTERNNPRIIGIFNVTGKTITPSKLFSAPIVE